MGNISPSTVHACQGQSALVSEHEPQCFMVLCCPRPPLYGHLLGLHLISLSVRCSMPRTRPTLKMRVMRSRSRLKKGSFRSCSRPSSGGTLSCGGSTGSQGGASQGVGPDPRAVWLTLCWGCVAHAMLGLCGSCDAGAVWLMLGLCAGLENASSQELCMLRYIRGCVPAYLGTARSGEIVI